MTDFKAPTESIEIDSGDDETIVLTREKQDGTKHDITGWTFWLTVKDHPNDPDSDAVLQKQVTSHSDPTNGETRIDLTASDTSGLSGAYRYDIQEETDGGTTNTVLYGTFYVRQDVTEA